MDPTKLYMQIVKGRKEWDDAQELCMKHGQWTQNFELPPLQSWVEANANGHGMIIDCCHFLPLTLKPLSVKRGMHIGCFGKDSETADFHRMECRNWHRLFWAQWLIIDPQNCPRSYKEYFEKFVIVGEEKCFISPNKKKGAPFSPKKMTPLVKNSDDYNEFVRVEEAMLTVSMYAIGMVAKLHNVESKNLFTFSTFDGSIALMFFYFVQNYSLCTVLFSAFRHCNAFDWPW